MITSLLFVMDNKLRLVLPLILVFRLGMVIATTLTLVNKCDYTVWPGILSNAGIAALPITGFSLLKGESETLNPPPSWGGRLWGRTLCSSSGGAFSCLTGDCGSGEIECVGGNASPPATLAEFTLDGGNGQDFFDVSLVDGFNLPMLVAPQGGTGVNCSSTGCAADLNSACPSALRVLSEEQGRKSVACKSACEAFKQPQYCCSGDYGSPDTCNPSTYSQAFKKACPSAYSYAYDDKSSTFVCAAATGYIITFCPPLPTSQKASSSSEGESPTASRNSSMVYEGALDVSGASSIHKLRFLSAFWLLHQLLL